ncbi:MAG: hypothetical protein IT167_27665 [Bryobacterales bacterium]|nr:hypothetical protein [Bryobacterales bacterium]
MYRYFATLVSYPGRDIWPSLDESIQSLAAGFPESAAMLGKFRESAVSLGQDALEEMYLQTFEMRAESALYIGHQIFSEDWRRGLFMAGLKEQYRARAVSVGLELPDHLSVVLSYLESLEPGQEMDELVGDCIIPAVRKVLQAIEGKSPYSHVLDALLHCLPPSRGSESEFEEISCRTSSLSLFPILR